jgi:hypothetical protein
MKYHGIETRPPKRKTPSTWIWCNQLVMQIQRKPLKLLLLGYSCWPWSPRTDTMYCTLVIDAARVGILVTIKVWQEASFIGQCMFQRTWALWNFSSKIFEVTIVSYPFIAQFLTPSGSIFAFPLAVVIPTQWNWFTPQDPTGNEV